MRSNWKEVLRAPFRRAVAVENFVANLHLYGHRPDREVNSIIHRFHKTLFHTEPNPQPTLDPFSLLSPVSFPSLRNQQETDMSDTTPLHYLD
ncbi:hypothetical protein, partial [Burkholderia cepacia]|uniref:hypothetical protein n=1 Tax=Burkholderia cepacia TaxID=292 RepID=UPI002FE2A3F9